MRAGLATAARQRGLEALAAWEAVAARHPCTVAQAQVAEALQHLGDLAVHAGRMGVGRDFHQRALVVRRALAAIPAHDLASHELAASLMMCALLARAAGDTKAALALQAEAVALRHAILPEDPSEQDMRLVLCCATMMSMCQMDLQRPAEALATLAAATPMAERLAARSADDGAGLDACATYWEAMAAAALAVGDEPARAHATARAEQVRASMPDED